MARETDPARLPATGVAPAISPGGAPVPALLPSRGLLVSADPALVRAFRRELRDCPDCSVSFDVQASIEDVRDAGGDPYRWVTIDLDAAIAPSDAVRLARRSWPEARIAVLSCWWSERDAVARDLADVVIHKPLRSTELLALLRSPTIARPADDASGGTAAAVSNR